MKKINLKGISEILSSKELKNVFGGSAYTSGSNTGGRCITPGFDCDLSRRIPCCNHRCTTFQANSGVVAHVCD